MDKLSGTGPTHATVLAGVTSRSAWPELRRAHEAAVRAFTDAAAAIPARAWLRPSAEAKWCAAEIVEHVALGMDVMATDLRGGPRMAMRLRGWKLFVARHYYARRILRGRGFPAGARAPRETRPQQPPPDRAAALERLERATTALMTEVERTLLAEPRTTVQHAYFGKLTIHEAIMLSAQHMMHHRAQLAEIAGSRDIEDTGRIRQRGG